jgi:hypothetical protein
MGNKLPHSLHNNPEERAVVVRQFVSQQHPFKLPPSPPSHVVHISKTSGHLYKKQQTARKKKKITANDKTEVMREVCCITY